MRQTRTKVVAVAVTVVLTLSAGAAQAQLRTMGKKCRAGLEAASQLNDSGDFANALAAFDDLADRCRTKDARLAIQLGRAHALNQLGRYEEAISAADAAIAVWKKAPSVAGYFERAYAEEQLGRLDVAEADYERMIELTENNRNVSERATIYAKVADLNRAAGKTDQAELYLGKAMELDPSNSDFTIMRGDWSLRDGDFDAAFAAYDRAVAQGRTDLAMYLIRTEARMKQMENKYGTDSAQELRAAMTPVETGLVCKELTKALDLGLRDMRLDMFAALVCR